MLKEICENVTSAKLSAHNLLLLHNFQFRCAYISADFVAQEIYFFDV